MGNKVNTASNEIPVEIPVEVENPSPKPVKPSFLHGMKEAGMAIWCGIRRFAPAIALGAIVGGGALYAANKSSASQPKQLGNDGIEQSDPVEDETIREIEEGGLI